SARPSLPLPGAAEAQRSVARAAGGERGIVPTSGSGARRLEGRMTCAARRWYAGGRRAPWGRDTVPRRGPLPPPNQALEPTAPRAACASSPSSVARRLTASVRPQTLVIEEEHTMQRRALGVAVHVGFMLLLVVGIRAEAAALKVLSAIGMQVVMEDLGPKF